MTLNAKEWEVRSIAARQGRAFIIDHHYSKGCSNTAVSVHGLFRKGSADLMGVAWWMPPTKVAAQSVNKDNWQRVLSLSRLCVHPNVPQNGASFLMAASIKAIRLEQKWVSLVTYADEFMQHTGAIYRATNWEYVGLMNGSPRWEDETGKQVARKSTVSRSNKQMEDLGCKMVGVFKKHKFVMHLHQRRKPELSVKTDLLQYCYPENCVPAKNPKCPICDEMGGHAWNCTLML